MFTACQSKHVNCPWKQIRSVPVKDAVQRCFPSNNISSKSQRITSILLEKLTHLAVYACVSQSAPVSCRHDGRPAAFHAGPGPTAAGAGGHGGGLPGPGDMEHRHM